MALLLGIDTGGTYTDAVLLDEDTDEVVAKAKALTTRPDLSIGIAGAVDAVVKGNSDTAKDIAMVSLSTTLATNALVEGQGGKIALILIGFDEAEFRKAGLPDAVGDDLVLFVAGGHSHSGAEKAALDKKRLKQGLDQLPAGLTGVAIASKFATRNPAHEIAARAMVRDLLGIPVTCSHELSKALGGPKRALTAVLNARLIGLIDRLIAATEAHLAARGIAARLMVVRGDGALISADVARERPIETILSGPAASIAGAQWLSGEGTALVSDIGGTTTDICVLKNGVPLIDPQGAKVGPYRTMVEAVAMRTFGLGGDSEVHVSGGLDAALTLGPRRVMPVSLLAKDNPDLVHRTLDRALSLDAVPEDAGRFVVPQWKTPPEGLDPREAAVVDRLADGPLAYSEAVRSRVEGPALTRLIRRGHVMAVGVTPSDASHVLGKTANWDKGAAEKALTLLARQRIGSGDRLAKDASSAAQMIIDQLTKQTSWALLETAFAEEGWEDTATLARHSLVEAGLRHHSNITKLSAGLALPVIGLGASAHAYYGAVAEALSCAAVLPEHGGVANAIGAVVGQVSVYAEGTITSGGEGAFLIHVEGGPRQFNTRNEAFDVLRQSLNLDATARAATAGADDIRLSEVIDIKEAEIESQTMFIEATMRVTARGRPRIAR
ncbi:MAG: hydantoinase/oxoprolinase family protein [Pseudomonadota bacterium]